jgi:hypothetical protein
VEDAALCTVAQQLVGLARLAQLGTGHLEAQLLLAQLLQDLVLNDHLAGDG